MNTRGVPDTLYLDPRPSYDIVVHTIPPVKATNIKLVPGKHTVIPIDAPRGNLLIKTSSNKNTQYQKTPIIIRKAGQQEILNVQYVEIPETYLVGKYDLEMLCLPILSIKNIEINQSYTTQIKIPNPGIAVVQKHQPGYGSLYVLRNNKMEWIYNLREDDTQESILLQPGTYKIVFREKYEYQTIKSITKTFIIRSDANTSVDLK
jgi:Ca-activated chloride channel family protein